MTFPEDVSFMTGDEPETGRPHHLRVGNASGKTRREHERELSADVSVTQNGIKCPDLAIILFCNGSRKS